MSHLGNPRAASCGNFSTEKLLAQLLSRKPLKTHTKTHPSLFLVTMLRHGFTSLARRHALTVRRAAHPPPWAASRTWPRHGHGAARRRRPRASAPADLQTCGPAARSCMRVVTHRLPHTISGARYAFTVLTSAYSLHCPPSARATRAPQHAAAAATAEAASRSAVGFSVVAISRRLPCIKPSGPSTGSRQFSTTQPPGGVPSRRGAPASRRLAVGLQAVQSTVRPTTHDSWRQRELNAQYQLPSFLPIPPSASAIYPALCACHPPATTYHLPPATQGPCPACVTLFRALSCHSSVSSHPPPPSDRSSSLFPAPFQ